MNHSKAQKFRIYFAALIGPAIEWFDYLLYGAAAALVFGTVFFPNFDGTLGMILSYATFGVSFLSRPLGSLVFSNLGDKVGRKKTLVLTLTGMGVITVIIGLLPGYATIGIWAPILLTLLRFLQGICVGGEWGGAVVYITELAPKGKRGFYGSIPQMGVPIGLLMAGGSMALMTSIMSDAAFVSWGWRIPFIASLLLVIVGLWIRSGLPESQVFEEQKKAGQLVKSPIAHTLKYHWKTVLKLVGCKIGENAFYYIVTTYIMTFATLVGYSKSSVLTAINIAAVITIFTIPAIGYLSDFISRRKIYIFGCALMVIFSIPYFFMTAVSYGWLIFFTIFGLSVVWGLMYTVQGSLFPEVFPTNVRFTGASLGQQVAGPLGGGLAPIISVYLYSQFNSYWALSGYLIIVALISLISAVSLKEVSASELADVRADDVS
jgi:metabolite-proton symporter